MDKENFVNCEKSSEVNFNWNDERLRDLEVELFKEMKEENRYRI